MTVKMIFKTLIGTVVAIVVGFLLIETFNLSINQFILRSVQKMAAEQSAQLFCQETYKQQDNPQQKTSKSTVFADIRLKQRSIQGDFYYPINTQSGVEGFYNGLYLNNQNYIDFINGANCNYNTPTVYPAIAKQISGNTLYTDNFVTPANFGIPYLDPQFMERAFQWNIAMLFGQPDKNTQTIQGGGVAQSGYTIENSDSVSQKAYINYSGYRVYVGNNTSTKITGIKYHIYNTGDASQRQLFKNMTNIDPDNLRTLRSEAAGGYDDAMQLITQGADGQVYLQYLTVVQIDYQVEIGYEGLTPLKQMVHWIQNYRVRGLGDSAPTATSQGFNEDATDVLTGTCYYWMVA